MALKFITGITAESQDYMSGQSVVNDPDYVTTPAHPVSPGAYVTSHGWKGAVNTGIKEGSTSNWTIVSFYIQFISIDPAAEWEFLRIRDSVPADMLTMTMKTLGLISVKDKNGITFSIFTNTKADTWYLIDIKFKIENSNETVRILVNKSGANYSNINTNPGNATSQVRVVLRNPIQEIPDTTTFYCGGVLILEDDSSGIEDDPISYGQDFIGLWYDSNRDNAAPDFGSPDLDVGLWTDLQEPGVNDSNTGVYIPASPTKSGGVTCHDGPTRAGPKDDVVVSGWEILGATWTGRFKAGSGITLTQAVKLLYGSHAIVATNGTTASSAFPLTNYFQDLQIHKDVLDAETPLLTEWIQVGFEVVYFYINKDVICSELRAYVFFRVNFVVSQPYTRPPRQRALPVPF